MRLSRDVLRLDDEAEADRIAEAIRGIVLRRHHKRGAVVGLSGGIDSSVVAALCVRALGKSRVRGLLMPERDGAAETTGLGREVASHLGIEVAEEDITPVLQALRCYERRDEAIRSVVPEYGEGYRSKIVLPPVIDSDVLRVFSIVVESPDGAQQRVRLTPDAYLQIVAATNFKQRVRAMLEYYWADRLNYAVAGTPNRLEYDQGFFVKHGDGAADVKPIAHLYKTQVYALGKHLGLPASVLARAPTTDTYSLPQSQEEFYFSLPYPQMDLCLWARDHEVPPDETARALGLAPEAIERVYRDIDGKRRMARYLHADPATLFSDEGPG